MSNVSVKVTVQTYDGRLYQGQIQAIYHYAFGPWDNHGLSIDITTDDGEQISLDEDEIRQILPAMPFNQASLIEDHPYIILDHCHCCIMSILGRSI